jgi:hypothetical protein
MCLPQSAFLRKHRHARGNRNGSESEQAGFSGWRGFQYCEPSRLDRRGADEQALRLFRLIHHQRVEDLREVAFGLDRRKTGGCGAAVAAAAEIGE